MGIFGFRILFAGERFAELLRALAADRPAHARRRHEVAFVGGIDEDLRRESRPSLVVMLRDARAVLCRPTSSTRFVSTFTFASSSICFVIRAATLGS